MDYRPSTIDYQLTIVKIGGKVIDEESGLNLFLSGFAQLNDPKILVHGGGKIASDIGKKMGIEPVYHQGRRITDEPALSLVTMVYGGLVNKQIVAKLQALGTNALGLTGADGNVMPATKRPVAEIDYGFAGDLKAESINGHALKVLLESGFMPVLSPLTHNGEGSLLNTNADTIAGVVAGNLSQFFDKVQLIYCFEQPGVLADLETKSVIDHINPEKYQKLKASGVISEGMIPKMENAFDALRAGVQVVSIGHFADITHLAISEEKGTKITLQ